MLSNRPGTNSYFVRGPYYREMLDEIGQIPGVKAASLTDFVPFFTLPETESISIEGGRRTRQDVEGMTISTSPAFFSTLGIRVIAGTGFEERDGGQPSVLISKSLAAEFTKDPEELIGHRLRAGTDSRYQNLRIAGIVSDAELDLAHPEQGAPAMVYANIWQHPDAQGYPVLLIKTAGNSFDVNALRKIVDSKGREYVYRVRRLEEEKDGALLEETLLAYLSNAFGAIALAMAATGLFGILSYQVSARTAEIGVRMALGAQPKQIQWMVMRQIVAVVATGSCAGVLLSLLVGRMVAGLLFGVDPYSPWLMAYSLGVLGTAAAFAAWLPARRASLVNPVRALKHD